MAISFQIIDVRANQISASLEKVKAEKESGAILIGIEVTEKEFSDMMDLNIDPQHNSENADSKISAIKWTLENGHNLVNEIFEKSPIIGDLKFYTVRPDLDSIGSMVILNWLIEQSIISGYCVEYDKYFYINEDVIDRIQLIHQADCFIGKGEWKPNMLGRGYNDSILAPVARMVQDFKIPLEKRVELIGQWLVSGEFEESSAYKNAVEKERSEIIAALESGETTVNFYGKYIEEGEQSQSIQYGLSIYKHICVDEWNDYYFEAVDNLVIVISRLRAATSIGYDKCPVVICFNPEMPLRNAEGTYRKFTVCQFSEGFIDLPKVTAELNELEDGWGGSPVIIGSPQERDSNLDILDVCRIVAKYLK